MFPSLNKLEITALAAIALVYLLIILITPAGFWIIDEGNKFLWANHFAHDGTLALPDKAQEISPGVSAFKVPFSQKIEDSGNQVTSFSVLFILLISPLVALGGLKMGLIIPAAASLLMLLSVKKFAENMGLTFGALGMFILGTASPLLFYSVTLWEHSLALFIGITALNLTFKQDKSVNLIVAGLLLAVSFYIRPEMIIFAIGGWLFISVRNWKVLIGSVVGVIIIGLLNTIFTGEFLPQSLAANFSLKMGGQNIIQFLASRLDSVYALLFESSGVWYISGGIVLSFLIFLFLPGYFKFILPASLIALSISMWFDISPLFHIAKSNSLLFTAPFFFIALFNKPILDKEKQLYWLAFFILILTAVLAPVYRGMHFGPRMILSALPLLAILSVNALNRLKSEDNIFKIDAIYGLIAAQILITIFSIHLLEEKRSANVMRYKQIMQNSKTTIVSPQWWLQQEIPELYHQRNFFLVENPLELKRMLIDYYIEGIRFFTLLVRENGPKEILTVFAAAPPRQISAFNVSTKFPSLNLVGMNYAIGFDVEGAAELADELGVYYGQINNLFESEKYLRYAAEWDSFQGKYHYNLGYCLGKQGKYDEALAELAVAAELDPDNEKISKLYDNLRSQLENEEGSIIEP